MSHPSPASTLAERRVSRRNSRSASASRLYRITCAPSIMVGTSSGPFGYPDDGAICRLAHCRSAHAVTCATGGPGDDIPAARLAFAPKLFAPLPVLLEGDLAAGVSLPENRLGRVRPPAIVSATEQEPGSDQQSDPKERNHWKQQERRHHIEHLLHR